MHHHPNAAVSNWTRPSHRRIIGVFFYFPPQINIADGQFYCLYGKQNKRAIKDILFHVVKGRRITAVGSKGVYPSVIQSGRILDCMAGFSPYFSVLLNMKVSYRFLKNVNSNSDNSLLNI